MKMSFGRFQLTALVILVCAASVSLSAPRSHSHRQNADRRNIRPPRSSHQRTVTLAKTTTRAFGGAKQMASGGSPAPVGVPYKPSQYPNVMVRSVPSDNSKQPARTQPGWIYVKPGAPKPASPPTTFSHPKTVPGKTDAGGVIMYVDRSHFPRETATVSGSGVHVTCEKDDPKRPGKATWKPLSPSAKSH